MKQTTVDPVCGMKVDPATSIYTFKHDGVRYSFCCGGCLNAFKAEPKLPAAGSTGKRCCCG